MSLEVCRALLAAKADPRLADADGETPLHWAAAGGHAKAGPREFVGPERKPKPRMSECFTVLGSCV